MTIRSSSAQMTPADLLSGPYNGLLQGSDPTYRVVEELILALFYIMPRSRPRRL